MRGIINDNHWIWFDNITTAEEEVLWENFSVASPGTYVDPSQRGMWDGVFRKYNRAKQRMARPLLSMLRGVCIKHDIPLVIKDNRPKWDYHPLKPEEVVAEGFMPGITLDPHQIRAIRAACKIECGIIDIPTGGGKGEIICGICQAIDCPTIIIADQTVVIDQLKARLELREIEEDIGLFYAGQRPSGEKIVVGSIQSLQSPTKVPPVPERKSDETEDAFNKRMEKWEAQYRGFKTRQKNAKYLQAYAKTAEMILVDECDKATSDPYKKLFRHWFQGRRRYGFSGTPFDEDKPVEALVMQEHLGSVIAKETRANLEKIGRIIPCEYWQIAFGLEGSIKEGSAYDIARKEYMTENEKFHKLIVSLCNKYKGDGTLVLVDSIELGHNLEMAINATGLKAHFIYGKTPKRRRNELLRSFENRDYDVLIGGKIINRGLDLKGGCENLIIATGGKLQSDFIQKIGRALRHNKRGRSRVFDFYFRCNRYLYDHSKARLKAMVNAGYRTVVVFPGGSIDGAQLIRSRFQIRKRLLERPTESARQARLGFS
jgi:superfamily II DNA or RNA helicase